MNSHTHTYITNTHTCTYTHMYVFCTYAHMWHVCMCLCVYVHLYMIIYLSTSHSYFATCGIYAWEYVRCGVWACVVGSVEICVRLCVQKESRHWLFRRFIWHIWIKLQGKCLWWAILSKEQWEEGEMLVFSLQSKKLVSAFQQMSVDKRHAHIHAYTWRCVHEVFAMEYQELK